MILQDFNYSDLFFMINDSVHPICNTFFSYKATHILYSGCTKILSCFSISNDTKKYKKKKGPWDKSMTNLLHHLTDLLHYLTFIEMWHIPVVKQIST